MSYLYTFLGVTVWALTVSFSSHALIARENKKEMQGVTSFIEQKTKEGLSVLPASEPASNSAGIVLQKSTTVVFDVVKKQAQPTETVIRKVTTSDAPVVKPAPATTYRREREQEDEEGDDD